LWSTGGILLTGNVIVEHWWNIADRNVIVEHWWNIADRKTDVIGENLVPL
jgi:hypothetical protein